MIDLDTVQHLETISRFVLERSKCKTAAGKLRWNGFIPNKNGQTSVYRIDELPEATIWDIGNKFVLAEYSGPEAQEKRLVGRGDLSVQAIFDQKLSVSPDPVPHPRHANIVGWPEDKEDKVEMAKELEGESNLILNPKQ